MKRVELLNMEYGECVVLEGRDRSVLMVDCGSVSQRLREGDVPLESWVDQIADRYQSSMDRHFLLTHFHRDHLSGFQRILENREGYFSRVLLPRSPLDSHSRALRAGICSVRLPVRPASKRLLSGKHLVRKGLPRAEPALGPGSNLHSGRGRPVSF